MRRRHGRAAPSRIKPNPFAPSSRLVEALDAANDASGLHDAAHAFVLDVGDSRFADHRADADVYPASVIKVAIMAEVFRRFHDGSLRPDDAFAITANNLTTTAEPTPFVAGYRATVLEMTRLMITHSDNIATNQLIDVLRRESVTEYMRELGLGMFLLGRKLSGSEPLVDDPEMVGRNRLTPVEAGRLLWLVATDRVAGADAQREILAHCLDVSKLAAGLRLGDRFMHKTGETADVNHDAGILARADGKCYVIVLYTTLPSGDASTGADAAMSAWMRRLRQAL
jgi:beta-lactamase class A